jgi:hypothetical protein
MRVAPFSVGMMIDTDGVSMTHLSAAFQIESWGPNRRLVDS